MDKLLQQLVATGSLDRETAEKIGRDAATLKTTPEELMYRRGIVTQSVVAAAKARVLGIPYRRVDPQGIAPDLFSLIPRETSRTYRVAPLARSADMLVVGMVDPEDLRAQEALRFIAKRERINLGVYLIAPEDLEAVLSRYAAEEEKRGAREPHNAPPAASAPAGSRAKGSGEGASRTVVSEEAPAIKRVAEFLKQAVERKASDIHFEPGRSRMRVRMRVDGALAEVASLPLEMHPSVLSRLKVLSNLKIDETRIPQDGRFRGTFFDRDIDFRISTFPTPQGEKAAVRVLDPHVGFRTLGELGIAGRTLEQIEAGLRKPYGAILLTGPTGSGKTTTLYALMRILNKESVNIVSLEDPVEYSIDGINQSQIKPEIGYDFASGLRQILRQDPDVIMIGEIRDRETAALSVHAALTGHIVLATLHTNNSLGVVPRLLDLGVPPFLLPSALNLMMAQRLLLRLCENCRKPSDPSLEAAAIIKAELNRLPESVRQAHKTIKVFKAAGCEKCNKKGTLGRIGIFEVLEMTPELASAMETGTTEAKLLSEARRQGMITLRQDGILKALQGIVSIDEVLRETEEI